MGDELQSQWNHWCPCDQTKGIEQIIVTDVAFMITDGYLGVFNLSPWVIQRATVALSVAPCIATKCAMLGK